MKAILIISHGSRSPKTKEEVQVLVDRLKQKCDVPIFEYAFLELEQPSIQEGIDICIEKGASEVTVLLNFLNAGRHVNEDIPAIVKESQTKHPNIVIKVTTPVGQHEGIDQLFLDLIKD